MDAKQKVTLAATVDKAFETLRDAVEEMQKAFTMFAESVSVSSVLPEAPAEEVEEKKPATRTRKKSAEKPPEKPTEKPAPKKPAKVEEEEDPVIALVNKAVKDMTNEEIAEVLVDVGMSATGKREALIAKVVKAVQEGKIELEDSEDEESGDEDEVEVVEDEEEAEEDVLDEYALNDIENEDMPEARREAIIDYSEGIKEDFANKEITRKQLVDWLNEVNGTKDTMKKVSDEDLIAEYTHLLMLRVDDEGDFRDSGEPYTVNGIPYCCGNPLIEGEETYSCGVCKEEYELSE